MTEQKVRSDSSSNLRQQAEEMAKARAIRVPQNLEATSVAEIRHLLHELQVHQIELEMQNEALRQVQVELMASRERYFDLYNLAPMGYFTLNDLGLITAANATAGQMLGAPTNALLKAPFSNFLHPEDQDLYYLRRNQLAESGVAQVFELRMQ